MCPALVPETSAERADFEAGKERRAQRRREKRTDGQSAAPDAFPVRRLFFSGQSLVFSRRMKRMGVPSKPKLLRR